MKRGHTLSDRKYILSKNCPRGWTSERTHYDFDDAVVKCIKIKGTYLTAVRGVLVVFAIITILLSLRAA